MFQTDTTNVKSSEKRKNGESGKKTCLCTRGKTRRSDGREGHDRYTVAESLPLTETLVRYKRYITNRYENENRREPCVPEGLRLS